MEIVNPDNEPSRWGAPPNPGEQPTQRYGSLDIPPDVHAPRPRFEPRDFDLRPIRKQKRSKRIVVVIVLVAVVILALVAVGAYLLMSDASDDRSAPASTSSAAPAPAAAAAAPADNGTCPEVHTDRLTSGSDPGGTGSGPDAIMWFEHSFYVERNAARARRVVTSDAKVPSADALQRGIDTNVPQGTRHCVKITRLGDGRYGVTLTEFRPGGNRATYQQTITTQVVDGRTLITGIVAQSR